MSTRFAQDAACVLSEMRSPTFVVTCSPGFIDLQLNGAYGFDFSVYDNEESYKRGMQLVAERIIETGVTSYVRIYVS
jgi:N-acetylglucosamine-6-phosphate deacetylase